MDESPELDPMPGIRAILLAGFLSGNGLGLFYITVSGNFAKLLMEPLAVLGVFLAIGLAGLMVGTFLGLTLRLFQRDQKANEGWHGPIFVAVLASGTIGVLVTHALIQVFFG